MPRKRQETQQWIDLCRNGIMPFGHMVIDATLEVVGLVKCSDHRTIASHIQHSGFAMWRAINLSVRVRRIKMTVVVSPTTRIVWTEPGFVPSGRPVTFAVEVARCTESLAHFPEKDRSYPFRSIGNGTVEIVSRCQGVQCECQFTTEIPISPQGAHMTKMSFLVTALAALKATPVIGEAIAGPVLRLYDTQMDAEAEKRLADMIQDSQLANKETLRAVLKLSEFVQRGEMTVRQAEIVEDAATLGINRNLPQQFELSHWPLPVSKALVFQELLILFCEDPSPFRAILYANEFSVRGNEVEEDVRKFLGATPGISKERLKKVFQELVQSKPASEILRFIGGYLSAGTALAS